MGDKNFRLDTAFRPERYVFRVVPDLQKRTFEARGHLELKLGRAARSLVLHGVDLQVSRAEIEAGGVRAAARVSVDAESQTLTLDFDREVPAGDAKLQVGWTGIFHKDLRGLYNAGGVAVTQFEAADARRMFPCFDEPAFKAKWKLEVEAPQGLAVLSNAKVVRDGADASDRRVVEFEETPPISSYLVALVVGDLTGEPPQSVRGIPLSTWSVPSKAHLRAFGQECAAAVLPLLEDYFGRPYPFGKCDQVGIPDFEAGAMENVGCITFREVVLLLDPQKAPLAVRKRVAEVVTHELAHQWFGNLVTMQWWDDLWLNEAFATWMAFKIVDQWKPQWRLWDDFENGKAAALHLDSMESTHPIRSVVRNAGEATENFDVITYEKGGAMLRMIEGWLGEDAFRAGIRDYMQKYAWANATHDDLWGALARASGLPVIEVANGWISKGGHPLVEVRRDGAKVTLQQRRFFQDPAKFAAGTDDLWLVPVVLKWADDAGVHETRHLLRGREETLTLEAKGAVKFVCANRGGAGFYRTGYGDADRAALTKHGSALAPVERMNLVADAWALFRAGAGTLGAVLELVTAFAADTDYVVLGEIVSRLDVAERRFVTAGNRDAFRQLVRKVLEPQLAQVGWDAAPGEQDPQRLRRAAVLRALGLVARVPEIATESRRRLERFWKGETAALDTNLLDVASICAARVGDEALFDSLVERAKTDPDPAVKRRALASLGSFEDAALRDRAVRLLLTDTVPMQDASIYLGALMANPAAKPEAWRFVRANWPEVHRKTSAPMITRRVVEALGELTEQRAEVEAFLDENKELQEMVPQAIRQTRERLRLDEEAQRRGRKQLSDWLVSGKS